MPRVNPIQQSTDEDDDLHPSEIELVDNSSEGDNSDIDSTNSLQHPTDYSYSDTETESDRNVDIEDTNSLSDSSEGDNSEDLTITDNADTDNFVGNINLNSNHHTARNYRLYRNRNEGT